MCFTVSLTAGVGHWQFNQEMRQPTMCPSRRLPLCAHFQAFAYRLSDTPSPMNTTTKISVRCDPHHSNRMGIYVAGSFVKAVPIVRPPLLIQFSVISEAPRSVRHLLKRDSQ
jgi:hypothetical protein